MRRNVTHMKKEKNMDMQNSQLKTYKYLYKKNGYLEATEKKIKYKRKSKRENS
jgi:hypothetical protein